MFKSGPGRGPAVHLFRARALDVLSGAGMFDYKHYTGSPHGKYVIESRGVLYEMEPQEVNSYVIGVDDAYTRMRGEFLRIMDETPLRPNESGDDYAMRVIEALDQEVGHAVHFAAEPFLASREQQAKDTALEDAA